MPAYAQRMERLPPVGGSENEMAAAFLRQGVGLTLEAHPPEIFRLLLDDMFFAAMAQKGRDARGILLCRKLVTYLNFFDLRSFCALEGMWPPDALEYAYRSFYPALPEDLQREYTGLDHGDLLRIDWGEENSPVEPE